MSENMKPSGIKWIKDIPSSWNIIKVKHLATDKNSLFLDGDWIESDVIEESGIRYLTTGNVGVGYYKEQGSGYISEKTFRDLHCLKVLPYDLMVSRLNEPIGRACIVPNNESFYVVAVDNVIIRPNKNFNKRFLMYVMNTDGYAENGNIIARGATMSRVSRSQLGQFWISYPELSEQTLIANFLDEQCKKIDSIVTDIVKQIEILQKYKKSLITETVTKGIDKSVHMKDSGIDIVGDIVADWKIKRLKYLCKITTGNSDTQDAEFDGKYPFYVRSPIVESINKYDFEGEAVLMAGDGVGAGKVFHLARGKFGCHQRVYIIFDFKLVIPEYLYYFIRNFFSIEVEKGSAKSTVDSIRLPMLQNFCICFPDINEQKGIVNYLDKQCSKIDSIIESKKEQLTKITQHKKSLIYEYVTGKKRVKGVNNNGN